MASSTRMGALPALLVVVGPIDVRPRALVGNENLLDEAYRTHGSGIDGVGRAAWASVEAGF